MELKKFIKVLKWIPALIIVCCSWYLSNQQTIEHLPTFWNADKLVHLCCFAGFSFWVSFALNIKQSKEVYKPTVIISVYGIIDEIHQSFTPYRDCSVLDWCADTLGAVLGAFVFLLVIYVIQMIIANIQAKKNKSI